MADQQDKTTLTEDAGNVAVYIRKPRVGEDAYNCMWCKEDITDIDYVVKFDPLMLICGRCIWHLKEALDQFVDKDYYYGYVRGWKEL